MLGLLAVAGATVVASAGADDERSYQAELFNAFGLVEGSEVRISGVQAGTISDLEITPEKTALVSFEYGSEFPELKADASCSSEPQSLIAEYFLDCQPGSAEEQLSEPIPAASNQTTVQNDLVQNTLREPYSRRLQLLINEFGTGLVGNAENLNAAIRSGAPALRELRKVLKILGRQNTIIAQLNADSDTVFARLTERREDVVRFIDEAEDTARVSAERREDLSRNFELLDDFLFELKPVMVQLGSLARQQRPLLTDLRAAAPQLNRLGKTLPKFNDGTKVSLKALAGASTVGERALTKSTDEIAELNASSQQAFPAADLVAGFLESIDEPRNAVEEDARATYDVRQLPGEAQSRINTLNDRVGGGVGDAGYTGMEGLLNYVYYQTLTLNQFDQVGHLLHFILLELETSPCAEYNEGPTYPDGGTDPRTAPSCVAVLGDNQPGINSGPGVDFPAPRYDDSVCPDGSTDHALCDPSISVNSRARRRGAAAPTGAGPGSGGEPAPGLGADTGAGSGNGAKPPQGVSPETQETIKDLREILDLPPGVPLPDEILDGLAPSRQPANDDLLGFLFGP